MNITSVFQVGNCSVYFSIESIFTANQSVNVDFSIGSELFIDNQYAYGNGTFPAFGGFGADASFANKGIGFGSFPAFTGLGQADIYIPPQPAVGYGFFPPFSAAALGVDIGIGTGSGAFPTFSGKGGDYNYGEGSGNFPAFFGVGIEGTLANEITLFSRGFMLSDSDLWKDTIIFLYSNGQVSSSISANKEVIASIISTLQGSSTCTVLGEFKTSLLSNLISSSSISGVVNDLILINPSSRVWVVNMDTGASSQYENYGFNSFFDPDGEYFGIAEDGIYKLDGNDDAGREIDALLEIGSYNYGTSGIKKSHGLYIGCSSTGNLYMKVITDGVERIYQMTNHSATIQTHKMPISHRQLGSQWELTLMNENGDDFDISTIDFHIYPTTRRSK